MATCSVKAVEKHQIASNCGICLETFRNPRRLPCSHCFCEECLENWIGHNKETKGEIVCPRCKENTEIPSKGVKGFPPGKIMEKVSSFKFQHVDMTWNLLIPMRHIGNMSIP